MSDTLKISGTDASYALKKLFDAVRPADRRRVAHEMQVIETVVHLARLGVPLLARGRALLCPDPASPVNGDVHRWLKDVDKLLPPA